jgi:hypothetical protein
MRIRENSSFAAFGKDGVLVNMSQCAMKSLSLIARS